MTMIYCEMVIGAFVLIVIIVRNHKVFFAKLSDLAGSIRQNISCAAGYF